LASPAGVEPASPP